MAGYQSIEMIARAVTFGLLLWVALTTRSVIESWAVLPLAAGTWAFIYLHKTGRPDDESFQCNSFRRRLRAAVRTLP